MVGSSTIARLHGRPMAEVPRWIVRAAYATTLTTLPSAVWRIAAVVFHVPLLEATSPGQQPGEGRVLFDGPLYVITLSVVSEALAFLTVGLVSRWGEIVPRWIPLLGGRRVPTLAAVVPAGAGAAILTVLWTWTFVMLCLGRTVDGTTSTGLHLAGWQVPAFIACYGPLLAWGPLLGIVTVAYYRRRRTAGA